MVASTHQVDAALWLNARPQGLEQPTGTTPVGTRSVCALEAATLLEKIWRVRQKRADSVLLCGCYLPALMV